MIEIVHDEVSAGGMLAFRLAIRTDEAGSMGPTAAWLVWRTEILALAMVVGGQVTEDYRIVETMRLEPAVGASPFEFRIPEEGPVSYEGRLFRVLWEVVVGTQSPSDGPLPAASKAFRVVARRTSPPPPAPA